MSEPDYSLEIALLDNLIGKKHTCHYQSYCWGKHKTWGGAIMLRMNNTPEESPDFWLADKRQENISGWEGGQFFDSFEDVVCEVSSPEFRKANGLPPIET